MSMNDMQGDDDVDEDAKYPDEEWAAVICKMMMISPDKEPAAVTCKMKMMMILGR